MLNTPGEATYPGHIPRYPSYIPWLPHFCLPPHPPWDGYYATVFASPPCSTFSVSRFFSSADSADGGPPPVRDRDHVMGLPDVPSQHARELAQANEITRRTATLLRAAHATGAEYVLEHPADRGALASPTYLYKRHAPIWLVPDVRALQFDTGASAITFPQCALGATTQKYTTLLVSPGLAPSLQSLSSLRCQHASHAALAWGAISDAGWTSRLHSAYHPDFSFLVAKVIGSFRAARRNTVGAPELPRSEQPASSPKTRAHAVPALPAQARAPESIATRDVQPPPRDGSNATPAASVEAETSRRAQRPAVFQRTLGTYPLRSSGPSALLTLCARQSKPRWGRGTGCAFAVNNVSTDPHTRKLAMAEDRVGWGALNERRSPTMLPTGAGLPSIAPSYPTTALL
eukprot:3495255-Pleurochrysis_carterae.AAC.3